MAWRLAYLRGQATLRDQRGDVPARFFLIAIAAVVLAYMGVILLLLLSAEQAFE